MTSGCTATGEVPSAATVTPARAAAAAAGGPAPAQLAAELIERVAGPGIDLQLLLLQLELEWLHRVQLPRRALIGNRVHPNPAAPRAGPACRDDGAGQRPWAASAGLDDQEFLLHPNAAHAPPFRQPTNHQAARSPEHSAEL